MTAFFFCDVKKPAILEKIELFSLLALTTAKIDNTLKARNKRKFIVSLDRRAIKLLVQGPLQNYEEHANWHGFQNICVCGEFVKEYGKVYTG